MALGGYKFAGRYCNKGSLADTEWALLMHKTKVAAFLAANTRASAGWAVDMADSDDGDYHKLDPVGYNYVTRFANASAGGWFYILTLCKTKASPSASDIAAGYCCPQGFPGARAYYMYGPSATNHIRLSKIRLSLAESLYYWTNRGISPIMAAGNFGSRVSSSSSWTGPTNSSYVASATVYFGYAIKSGSIVCLSGIDTMHLQVSVASIGGFSSLTVPGDEYNIFVLNCSQTTSNGYNEGAGIVARDGVKCMPWSCGSDGFGNSFDCSLETYNIASNTTSTDEISFNSIYLSGVTTDQSITGEPLCFGKGTIGVDLAAVRLYVSNYPDYTNRQAVANGKYIAVMLSSGQERYGFNDYGGALTGQNRYMVFFVGWDESNPALVETGSWTEYIPEG